MFITPFSILGKVLTELDGIFLTHLHLHTWEHLLAELTKEELVGSHVLTVFQAYHEARFVGNKAFYESEKSLNGNHADVYYYVKANVCYYKPPKTIFESLDFLKIITFLIKLDVQQSWGVNCNLIYYFDNVG